MSSSPNSSSSSEAARGPGPALASDDESFARLVDVRCPVSVVLGTGTISVRECLALVPRSVVRLKQSAGEDVQVVVGNVAVARAEVVIVEDSTAVRLTEILKPALQEES
jgi:flagellar motor switch protein FliN/FliY